MDIMAHPHPRWTLLNARAPGGASGDPVPIDDPGWTALDDPGEFTVGVVDTGVLLTWDGRMTHPWLSRHVSICPEDDEDTLATATGDDLPTLRDGDGHGTFVTGLILKEAPRARVRMYAAIDTESAAQDGLGQNEDRLVAAAIRSLAVNPRIQVINLSFGGGVFDDRTGPPTLLQEALEDVDFRRVAVVAAAGNEPSGTPTWPAAFTGVIGVGAVHEAVAGYPALAPFSNRGSWVAAYASGVDVAGPFLNGAAQLTPTVRADQGELQLAPGAPRLYEGWASWSGTSFAAATVSGRIAAYAMERGLSGADAAAELLADAPVMPGQSGKLIA
jgi:hypothetical protein